MPDGIRIHSRDRRLEAAVDPLTHRIREMSARIEPPELQSALVRSCLGNTVQDVSEHAMIRVESVLRGAGTRPVPGVIQPENAGPRYAPLLAEVRSLLQDYIAQTGYRIVTNTEEGRIHQESSEWGTSTVSERLQRILAVLPAACAETGIRGAEVKVKTLAGPRLTVELPASASKAAQQKYLTLLELELRAKVDPRIEVFLDDKKDANAKRHAPSSAPGI